LGARRKPAQDLLFLIDQLVNVATGAVSPGASDLFTAIYRIDSLITVLGEFADR
jgi:uncharacterized membrane protein